MNLCHPFEHLKEWHEPNTGEQKWFLAHAAQEIYNYHPVEEGGLYQWRGQSIVRTMPFALAEWRMVSALDGENYIPLPNEKSTPAILYRLYDPQDDGSIIWGPVSGLTEVTDAQAAQHLAEVLNRVIDEAHVKQMEMREQLLADRRSEVEELRAKIAAQEDHSP